MKKQSVKLNFFLQISYQLIVFLIPMISAPYLTRVLGSDNLGTYAFTYSVSYYFVIFATLGISKYGQRIIAERKEDECRLRTTFWSLFFVHSVFSIIALVSYIGFTCCVHRDITIYLIQGLYVCSALFDITWLFYGLENFRSVVIKNFIIKIMSTVCLFVFVKSSNDLAIYTMIMSSSVFLGQIAMLPEAIKEVKPIKFRWSDCREHFKPLFVLSIAVVAVTLYTVFDKTLIGIFVDKANVAFYEYADKIIRIPLIVISVVGTVVYPRACFCFSINDIQGIKKYFKYSLAFSYFVGFGVAAGLVAVSDLFVIKYYGNDFLACSNMIKAMTPLILIVSLGDIVRMQYLIPMKKDVQYTVVLIINAVINLSISIVLLSLIGTYGAIVGTICAELFGLVAEISLCRKHIEIKTFFYYSIPAVVSSALMFLCVELIKNYYNDSIPHLIFQIVAGGIVYTLAFWGLSRIFIKEIWIELLYALKKRFRSKI